MLPRWSFHSNYLCTGSIVFAIVGIYYEDDIIVNVKEKREPEVRYICKSKTSKEKLITFPKECSQGQRPAQNR